MTTKLCASLLNSLTGAAREWYKGAELSRKKANEKPWNFENFESEFQKAFPSAKTDKILAEQRALKRKQELGEKPHQYVNSKRNLLFDWDPKMSPERQIRFYIQRLKSNSIETELRMHGKYTRPFPKNKGRRDRIKGI